MSKAAELAALIANVNKGSSLGNKNFIINGAMNVAQRGTSATASGNGTYDTIDRWKTFDGNDGAFTSEQSTDSPEGFSNSLKLACTTADTSLASNTYASFLQSIEAQNLQSLDYGSSDAKPITLSFWVKSNKTGTYCIAVEKTDSTTYRFVKEYTISSANTWEYKTITILPDSNIKGGAGAIADDNGVGLVVLWSLGHGSDNTGATDNTWHTGNQFATNNQVNWMDSTSNNFYLTGCQLEIGEKATEFEHISPNVEIERCKRYYTRYNSTSPHQRLGGSGFAQTTDDFGIFIKFSPEMRGVPTLDHGTLSKIQVNYLQTNAAIGSLSIDTNTDGGHSVNLTGADVTGDPLTAGDGVLLKANNDTDAYIAFDAEL